MRYIDLWHPYKRDKRGDINYIMHKSFWTELSVVASTNSCKADDCAMISAKAQGLDAKRLLILCSLRRHL